MSRIYTIIIEDMNSGILAGQIHRALLGQPYADDISAIPREDKVVTVTSTSILSEEDISGIESIVLSITTPDTMTELEGLLVKIPRYKDYMKHREEARLLVTEGFDDKTDKEKYWIARYCLDTPEVIVPYYMSLGMSESESIDKFKMNRAEDISMASLSCRQRLSTPIIKYLIIKHLTESDGVQFVEEVDKYLRMYETMAHLGKNYGQGFDGIMDFIESTNAHADGGLSAYTFNSGTTYEVAKNELKNYLVFGIIPPEYN